MAKYTVRPINTGFNDEAETTYHYYLPDHISAGVKIDEIYWMFLAESRDTLILIDTGPGDPETWGRQVHHHYERHPEQVPTLALANLGIAPEDIDIVINTHLHWQNCHNNHLFPRAVIYIQASEIEEALDPVDPHRRFYTPPEMQPPWMQCLDRTRLLHGTTEIADGVQAIAMPSHTLGFQGVLLDSVKGPIFIAGDFIPYYDNWSGRWGMQHIPSGIMQSSLREYYQCFSELEEIDPAIILPGVDPKVGEHDIYG